MGQYERALADAIEADRQPWEWGAPNRFPELIEAAARGGQPAVASAQLERLAEMVEPSGSDWGMGVYARSHAILSTGRAAEDLYNEAIDHLERTAIRPELARADLLYGEWLRREHRRADAARISAPPTTCSPTWASTVSPRARSESCSRPARPCARAAADSFDELTSQEANVARLAADGRTNPEIGAQLFISPRTVEYHLHKVFTKLDITSRQSARPRLSATVGS